MYGRPVSTTSTNRSSIPECAPQRIQLAHPPTDEVAAEARPAPSTLGRLTKAISKSTIAPVSSRTARAMVT